MKYRVELYHEQRLTVEVTVPPGIDNPSEDDLTELALQRADDHDVDWVTEYGKHNVMRIS